MDNIGIENHFGGPTTKSSDVLLNYSDITNEYELVNDDVKLEEGKNTTEYSPSNAISNSSQIQLLEGTVHILAGSRNNCGIPISVEESGNDIDKTEDDFIKDENGGNVEEEEGAKNEDEVFQIDGVAENTTDYKSLNARFLARNLKRRSIKSLNKMQIMEDVREGCDANPPSSPGHAEERHGEVQLEKSVKTEDVAENGIEDEEKKEGTEETKEVSIKEEQDDKKSEEEVEDKQEENSSGRSSASENNNKRKLGNDQSPIKRLKTEIEDNFVARDKIMNEFVEVTECNTLEQVQSFSDQILSEIKALNEMAKEKEREWNQLLHLKKLKEELLIRLQRKRQVLIINDSDLNEYQTETNGQQSLLKCNQKVNMLRELRAANLEKLKQRSNMLQNAYKQKPMLDVQSIIADYRQRHPETVPRRGGSLTIGQKSAMENSDSGLLPNIFNGIQDDSRSSSVLQNSWYRPGEDIKSYKDMLLQFTKLSQAEKSELQMQLQNSTKPPPPYPEVTVHPVTSTSSVAPANSLLHGILTKAPIRQNNSNGNTTTAVNGGKTSFSPTLARLLTAPEKTAANQITSTPTMMGGNLLNSGNMSLSEIFSGNKVRNEITITPVGSQYEASTKRESTEEESEDQTDRLVIDEALESSNSRNKEDNRSEDGEDVPQCQGCNQKAAQFVCAGCGNQWYCSRDCQVAAWEEHSEVCSG